MVNMAAPATEHVRNIVLVGQDGAGKTSLAEAMLHVSGRTPRMGTTHDGKSYLDYDEEEIRRKFTIGTSIAPIPYKDYKINLLDTSGHPDFIGDTLATMQAAEMALFVVDAVAGPQVMTTKLWREAEDMRLSRAVFINHIDRENADFDTAMALLHARFGSRLGPVTIPIGVDADFKGVIDIIRMKARYFDAGSEKERIEEIPPEYADAAQAARDKLCDLVAEADDELMMKYLDGEEQLTQEELEQLLDKAIAQELFIPVFVGSTIIEQGIQGVMEDIATYFPHPRHHGRFRLANGEETFVDETGEPAGFVFKTVSDPFVGRLSFMKVISGVLEPGMELVNARTGKKDRLGHLYVMMGKETNDVKSAKAGDIVVVPKLTETRTGDTLSKSGTVAIDPLPLPEPQYPVAIEAVNKKDEDKLGTFLARVVETDPTVRVNRSEETHQTVVTAMGQMFYSLSIAMGILVTFGSYMKKDVSIEESTENVEVFDTAIAIMAGLMIIPAVFAFSGGDPDTLQAGPALMFITIPKVFASMGLGTAVGVLFFVLVLFAAITSSIALTESAVSTFEDELGWDRTRSTVLIGAIMVALGSLSALGYGPLAGVTVFGMQFLDFFDFLTNSVMMPIAAIATCLLVSRVIGVEQIAQEVEQDGQRFRRKPVFNFMIRWLCPIFAAIILASSVANAFGWIAM